MSMLFHRLTCGWYLCVWPSHFCFILSPPHLPHFVDFFYHSAHYFPLRGLLAHSMREPGNDVTGKGLLLVEQAQRLTTFPTQPSLLTLSTKDKWARLAQRKLRGTPQY